MNTGANEGRFRHLLAVEHARHTNKGEREAFPRHHRFDVLPDNPTASGVAKAVAGSLLHS